VIQPRSADDFAAIRARIEELRYVTRPRAADDFAAIQARLEELRRERDQVVADQKGRSPVGPRPYRRPESVEREPGDDRLLPRSFRRFVR
jgi:tetrahydromethanopterin S-methyltransferase subunit G